MSEQVTMSEQVASSIEQSSTNVVEAFQQNVINQMGLLSDSMQAASKVSLLTSRLAVKASVVQLVMKSAQQTAKLLKAFPDSHIKAVTCKVMIEETINDAALILVEMGVPIEVTKTAMYSSFPEFAEITDQKLPTHYREGNKFVKMGLSSSQKSLTE